MLIDLVGVLEDGSPPGFLVPTDTRRAVTLPRSVDVTIRLRTRYRGGPPIIPATVDEENYCLLSIWRKPQEPPLMTLEGSVIKSPFDGYTFTLTPANLNSLDPIGAGVRLLYDVRITRDDIADLLVPLSVLAIEPGRVA